MTKKYKKEYTVKLKEAVHDEETDSLIGLDALDSVRIADSLNLKGELANGAVNLYKQPLEIGKIIRFQFNEKDYKLMILKIEKEFIKIKITEV
ncbi:MAG: hypothetical protein ACPG4Z_00450 [Chitinophagales bacterium]